MSKKTTVNRKFLEEQVRALLEYDPEEAGRNQEGDPTADNRAGAAYDDREDPGVGATNPDNQEMGGDSKPAEPGSLDGCSEAAMKIADALGFSDLEKHAICKDHPEPESWVKLLAIDMARELGVGTLVHTILQTVPGRTREISNQLSKIDVGGRLGSALNIGYALFGIFRIIGNSTWKDSKQHKELKRKIGISTERLYGDLRKLHEFRKKKFDKNKDLNPDLLRTSEEGKETISFVYKFDPVVSILTTKKPKVSFTKANKFLKNPLFRPKNLKYWDFGRQLRSIILELIEEFPQITADDFKKNTEAAYSHNTRFYWGGSSEQARAIGQSAIAKAKRRWQSTIPEALATKMLNEELVKRFKISDHIRLPEDVDLISFINSLYSAAAMAFSPRIPGQEDFIQRQTSMAMYNKIFMHSSMISTYRNEIIQNLKKGSVGEIAKDSAQLLTELAIFTYAGFWISMAGIAALVLGKNPEILQAALEEHKGLSREVADIIRMTNPIQSNEANAERASIGVLSITNYKNNRWIEKLILKAKKVEDILDKTSKNLLESKKYFLELIQEIGNVNEKDQKKLDNAENAMRKVVSDFQTSYSAIDQSSASQVDKFDFRQVRLSDILEKILKLDTENRDVFFNKKENINLIREKVSNMERAIGFLESDSYKAFKEQADSPGFNRQLTNLISDTSKVMKDPTYQKYRHLYQMPSIMGAPLALEETKENDMISLTENKNLKTLTADKIRVAGWSSKTGFASPKFAGKTLANIMNYNRPRGDGKIIWSQLQTRLSQDKPIMFSNDFTDKKVTDNTVEIRKAIIEAAAAGYLTNRTNQKITPDLTKYLNYCFGPIAVLDTRKFDPDNKIIICSSYRLNKTLKALEFEVSQAQHSTIAYALWEEINYGAGGVPKSSAKGQTSKIKTRVVKEIELVKALIGLHTLSKKQKEYKADPNFTDFEDILDRYHKLLKYYKKRLNNYITYPSAANIYSLHNASVSIRMMVGE